MEKTTTAEKEVLTKLYKNAKMGEDSVSKLLTKVSDAGLKKSMTEQKEAYCDYAKRIKMMLSERGEEAKEEAPFVKFWSSIGIAMNTMMDASASHVAEMMIEGSTMGVTDTTKLINEYEKSHDCKEVIELAREIVRFEQDNIEKMKKYL